MAQAAYDFDAEHRPLILTGAKDFTLRGAGRKPHPAPGERFDLAVVAGEGAPPIPFASARCAFRARVYIGEAGLLRVIHVQVGVGGEPLNMLFAAAEQGAYAADKHLPFLARRDGFVDWPALYAFHKAKAGRGKRVMREVIGWADVQPIGG